ncbi:MAG: Tim44/TimA family putative adaptor protein [Acetobacter sp.]|nr:Tim44/TimA family putative adaptor protein [Acetobacter sp.]
MDFSFGGVPVDLIFLALVALFLVLRLRSVLGKKEGIQPVVVPVSSLGVTFPEATVPPEQVEKVEVQYDIPAPNTRVGQILQAIEKQGVSFTPKQFLNSVQLVFVQIVKAYAEGNREVLKSSLTPSVYAIFEAAITARQESSQTQKTEIKAVRSLAIEDARITPVEAGSKVSIEVKIVSDQVSLVLDKDGQPVTGTDAITEFSDLWIFERVLGSQTSTWLLASACSA